MKNASPYYAVRRTFWRLGGVLAGICVALLVVGFCLYRFERNMLLHYERQQEKLHLDQVITQINNQLTQIQKDGQYLAKILHRYLYPKPPDNSPIHYMHHHALQQFLRTHPHCYRLGILDTEHRLHLDIINVIKVDNRFYKRTSLFSHPALEHAEPHKVVDLSSVDSSQRYLALVYPIALDISETKPARLIIFISPYALLPATLTIEELKNRGITILDGQLEIVGGEEKPDPHILYALKRNLAYKANENKMVKLSPTLSQYAANHHYTVTELSIPGFARNWILLKKQHPVPNYQSLRLTFWLLGLSTLVLFISFFLVIYYLLLSVFNKMTAINEFSSSPFYYTNSIDTSDEKVTKKILVEANQALHRLAHLDALTGLANRRAFDIYLAQTWQKAALYQEPISLIMIDVDCFKFFNDYYGHQAGDECLRSVARALGSDVRRMSDMVARYGGEEFAVILPNTALHDAVKIARTIQQRVLSLGIPHCTSPVSNVVTISSGVACMWPSQGYNIDDLIHLADQSLYKAKNSGRNTIQS